MIAYLDRMPSLLLLLYSVRFELLELVVLLSHDDTTKTVEFPKKLAIKCSEDKRVGYLSDRIEKGVFPDTQTHRQKPQTDSIPNCKHDNGWW